MAAMLPPPWHPLLAAPCPLPRADFLAALRPQQAPLRDEEPRGPLHSAPHPKLVVRNAQLDLVERITLRFIPAFLATDAKLHHAIDYYSAPDQPIGVVVLTPRVTHPSDMPPDYPCVQQLAYIWEPWEHVQSDDIPTATTFDHAVPCGRVSVHYVPFPTSPPPPPEFLAHRGRPHPALAFIASRFNTKPKRSSPLASTTSISTSISVGDPIDRRPSPPNKSDDKSDNRFEGQHHRPRSSLYQQCEEHLGRLFRQAQDQTLSSDPLSILSIPPSSSLSALSSKSPAFTHDLISSHDDAKVLDFSSLYRLLKERHRHLAKKKSSCPLDHLRASSRSSHNPDDPTLPDDLAEWGQHDMAVAAFLMVLWRDMYPRIDGDSGGGGTGSRAWDTWGRPKAGFVDLGCGNGLLVHILISEGYEGAGYDLRPRQTWSSYPSATQAKLHPLEIDPPTWFPDTLDAWKAGAEGGRGGGGVVRDGAFLIGNHADQLTPWIPLFSLLPQEPIPFLSFPCCHHLLSPFHMFTDATYDPPPHPHLPGEWLPGTSEERGEKEEMYGIYKSYVKWLGWVGLKTGWRWDVESVRGRG